MKFNINLEFSEEELQTLCKAQDIILQTGAINFRNLPSTYCPLGKGSELTCDDIPEVILTRADKNGTLYTNNFSLFKLWSQLDDLTNAASLIIREKD